METAQARQSAADALRAAVTALANTPSAADAPALTAQALLAAVLGLSRAQLLAHPERMLSAAEQAAFAPALARAAAGEPLAYILGRREFYGLDLEVTPAVLVPRPETERLVELAVARAPRRALDVGTGSGCIAVALAVNAPGVSVMALDVSPAALAVAARNAQRHGVSDRITFAQSDLLAALPPVPAYDLLCANLPYIDTDELRALPVAAHEPRLALDGGPGGLRLIERLLAQAPPCLAPGAALLLEIGAGQGPRALALAQAAFPGANAAIVPDLAGLDRVLTITP
ncbi:MAG: peptide chain release factor N(5)-glutamine methyltransferase [Anaerolineales bacterium]|nr:peptide chain release factor N(5)-glutamine methyltransferase [Anaerolineales bacterium]